MASHRHFPSSRSVGKAFADDALQGVIGASGVVARDPRRRRQAIDLRGASLSSRPRGSAPALFCFGGAGWAWPLRLLHRLVLGLWRGF